MRMLLGSVLFALSAGAFSGAVIEYDDGKTVQVPDGWEVVVQPKGFNTAPYSLSNPGGKNDTGWPWYNFYLWVTGCWEPGLVISPNVCPDKPQDIPSQYCYSTP